MNFLKQTALVLGLVSLSLGGWALFKNWRQKLAILYAILCFVVTGWAMSFVSFATLGGRLSKDIHLFFNMWLAPIGVMIVSKVLSNEDGWARWLFRISFAGAIPLSLAIGLSVTEVTSQDWFWTIVKFWPTFVLVEYIHVMFLDLVYKRAVEVDFISTGKRKLLYAGLGVSLAMCSFDHIPWMGDFVPAIGNLAFAAYLAFASQILSPQRLLGVEAMVSRFFAIVILSLVITGYFALLYQYMSETFGLFLLNSFLISLAVLVLWSPLVTLFRFLAQRMFRTESEIRREQLGRFKLGLSGVTSHVELSNLLQTFFVQTLQAKEVELEFDLQGLRLPEPVRQFFRTLHSRREPPILHRVLVQLERDQVLTQERKGELNLLLQYLDLYHCDLVFPVYAESDAQGDSEKVIASVRLALPTSLDEWTVSFGYYGMIYSALQILSPTLQRIQQVESTLEKDRLALMGEMAAGLAHEIRNPLGAIKGASELLLRPDGQVEGRWAKVIHEEVDRLNRLVSQFLDFSHTSPDLPDNVNLHELVERALAPLRSTIKNNTVIEVIPPDQKILALVVPDQIQQVLINLVQNGIKATDPAMGATRDPRIQVQIFRTGFLVQDNGVGMAEDTLERVFHPFFSSFRTGSGLGLSICKRLVAANDGSIQIQSRLGEGTTVKVNLCETRSS